MTEAVGDFIRRARRRKGWSIREAARHAGISDSYWSQLERGRKTPRPGVLWQLAVALDLTGPERHDLFALAGIDLDDEDKPTTAIDGMGIEDWERVKHFADAMIRRLRRRDQG
jgi:transcriptional regulator with XRE-family HTH domain